MALTEISIRGAREHNLKGIDLDIPRGKLVVLTGLSGSGKSTLAFDTIYAEGQRKYMESLSAYARQFLDQMQKPDVESIEGLPPTIAIEQRGVSHNPRSTVATTTEIYDYLRLLYARAGQPRCWHVDPKTKKVCGHAIESQSATMIIDFVCDLPIGTRLMVLAPVIRGKKGHHKEVFEAMLRQGFVRARVDGELMDLREITEGKKFRGGTPFTTQKQRYQKHTIEAVIDRIVVKSPSEEKNSDIDPQRQRIADAVELSLKLADGLVIISSQSASPKSKASKPAWSDALFSEKYACTIHPECSLEDLEPRLFSFNSPYGACPTCAGLGTVFEFDPDLVVPDPSKSLDEGAIAVWKKNGRRMNIFYNRIIRKLCKDFKIDKHEPFKKLTKRLQRIILDGTNERDEKSFGKHFEGVLPNLQRRFENTDSDWVKQSLSSYLSESPCEVCKKARLRPAALNVFLEAGKGKKFTKHNISDVTAMTIEDASQFFSRLRLSAEGAQIAEPILKEIKARLGFMLSVGLGYLNLSRNTGTLSGGESQRIRLATQVGSGLVGCCYVLDEPTIGLHQRDNERLIKTLRHLTDIGNTVLVVEHDEDTINASDWLIDIGPGPGRHGGEVVAHGPLNEVKLDPHSLTAKYLRGEESIAYREERRELDHKKALCIKGARHNNLKAIDVDFPLGGIVTVTGVSGSGKSTLVNQVLLKATRKALLGSKPKPGLHDKLTGWANIDRIIEVDQSPIGRTPRSNPATYTGVFDMIRDLFTKTTESKIRGYKPGRFSFNVKGGRCEACTGQGVKKIEMHFLPDVFVQCDVCKGKRYNRETLEITYRGKNISDVLDMTIEEALAFFDSFRDVKRLLTALNDVGLSYVQLGQASTTLSGGEAQRVKLATELGKRSTGHTLYVLDEPTTGLHFADVKKLLSVLDRLADQGNSVVLIEHNMDVIKCSDWLIDLGPEGGDRGGKIVTQGTPEEVADCKKSYTGQYLREHLSVAVA